MATFRLSIAIFRHDTEYKLAFLVLMYLDVALTLVGVRLGFTENNPIMAGMLADPWKLLLFKGIIPAGLAWLIPGRLLAPATLFLAALAAWNLLQLSAG